ncbi:MAG: hypothetical protein HKN28_03480 [Alphaproteobacteria bacterium]|nr:hypothetical protein [Alphaproteobacteria bacterium]
MPKPPSGPFTITGGNGGEFIGVGFNGLGGDDRKGQNNDGKKDEIIYGNGGDDTIYGFGGEDTVYGGDDND